MPDASPLSLLEKYWGHTSFRPCQLEIIQSVLAGNDTLGLLPTGGGKSVTFQIPALILPGVTLVVTPLISLMKDQVDHLRQAGIKAAAVHSGLSRGDCQLVQPLQVENRGQPGLDIAHKALIDGDFSEQQSQRAAQPEQPEIAGRQGRKVRKGTGCG